MAFNNEMLSYFANKMWRKNKDTFVSKETGKSLSANDYTNEDKNKLDNLSAETTTYDNTDSGLTSTNVQGAIDEISEATTNLPTAGTQITGVLNAGETEITFTNDAITSDSTLNAVYTSKYGMSVNSAVFGEGSLTLTFSAQEENIDILVVIDASLSYGGNGKDGADGTNGKSAYEYAVEGGYTGTETEFAQLFNNMGGGNEWKEAGSATGTNTITLHSSYNELLVACEPNYSSSGWVATNANYPILLGTIPRNILSSTKKYIALTNFASHSEHIQYCEVYADLTSLELYQATMNGGSLTEYYKTTVYYR